MLADARRRGSFFCLLCAQVPALLDASMDLGGGKMNIHVLMALAAFASAFLGNALEGALLLAMFALSHVGEDTGPGYDIRGVMTSEGL